jgi:hypothetical protein
MKTQTKSILIGLGIGFAIVFSFAAIYNKRQNSERQSDDDEDDSTTGRSIIIGDSQTPYIAKQSTKIQMLGQTGGENVLWKGGMGLSWLKGAVSKYPVTKDVSNVVINIGTNGGFNSKEDIAGLVNQLKRVFPNARLFAVQGSWGWGGNKNITKSKVDTYYDNFEKEGVIIITPAIGVVSDPHGHLPIYKEIGKSIDAAIK